MQTANTQIANKTLSPGNSFGYNTVGVNINVAETYSLAGVTHLRAEPGFSNFEATVDISGGDPIDITVTNNYCGIINLTSSNPTESITKIDNPPQQFPFILYPANGLAVTFNATAVPAGANDIALSAASILVDGTQEGWVQFQIDRLGIGYSVLINYQSYI